MRTSILVTFLSFLGLVGCVTPGGDIFPEHDLPTVRVAADAGIASAEPTEADAGSAEAEPILQGGNAFGSLVDIGSNDRQIVVVRSSDAPVYLMARGSGSVVVAAPDQGRVLLQSGTAAVKVAAVDIGDTIADGPLGGLPAFQSVDIGDVIRVKQDSGNGARVATLPAPTWPSVVRTVTLVNVGLVPLTIYGKTITPTSTSPATSRASFLWDGTAWGGFAQ